MKSFYLTSQTQSLRVKGGGGPRSTPTASEGLKTGPEVGHLPRFLPRDEGQDVGKAPEEASGGCRQLPPPVTTMSQRGGVTEP